MATTTSEGERAQILALAAAGRSSRAIAAELRLSQSTVSRVIRSAGAASEIVVGTDGSHQRRVSQKRLEAAARRRLAEANGDCPVCFEPMPCDHDAPADNAWVVGEAGRPTRVRCWACSGHGVSRGPRGRWIGCSACEGTGEVDPSADASLGWTRYEYEPADWWATLVSRYVPDEIWAKYQQHLDRQRVAPG